MHVYLIAWIVAPALASACASPPHVDAAFQPRPAWNIAAHAVRALWDAHWRYTARRARRGGRLFWRVGRGRDPRRPRIVYRLGRIVSRPLALPAIELWRANPSRCGCAADLSLSHSFLWKAHGEDVSVFKWTGKNDYVALCEPESISFGGGCAMMISYPAVLNIIDHPFYLGTGIMGSILTRRSTRAPPRAVRRLTTTHSPAPARTVEVVALPRSSVSGSRCGVWRHREHQSTTWTHCCCILGVLRRTSDACTQARCAIFFSSFRYVSDDFDGLEWNRTTETLVLSRNVCIVALLVDHAQSVLVGVGDDVPVVTISLYRTGDRYDVQCVVAPRLCSVRAWSTTVVITQKNMPCPHGRCYYPLTCILSPLSSWRRRTARILPFTSS